MSIDVNNPKKQVNNLLVQYDEEAKRVQAHYNHVAGGTVPIDLAVGHGINALVNLMIILTRTVIMAVTLYNNR